MYSFQNILIELLEKLRFSFSISKYIILTLRSFLGLPAEIINYCDNIKNDT